MKTRDLKLAELHVHLGSSVDPAILWSMAHEQGFKLPTKEYWDFVKLITASKNNTKSLEDYLSILHKWTETIQSSPYAVERSVYEMIGGAYRRNNITLLEIRFNPMKRNQNGERDLDHIIMAALRGMDRALLEYPHVKCGLIFCLDRGFTFEKNCILANKAIKYKNRGVVGLDFANSQHKGFSFTDYEEKVKEWKKAGLKLTVHTGETNETNDMEEAIRILQPNRIGHGIKAAFNKEIMQVIKRGNIVLEICPTSNLATKAVKDIKELKSILDVFKKEKIGFCINTDGPEVFQTNLLQEIDFLLQNMILTEGDILESNKIAFSSTFIPQSAKNSYLSQ
jgi:adenosine deaminase